MSHASLRAVRLVLLCMGWAAAVACSGSKKKPDQPAELVDIKQTLRVDRVWSAGLGGEPRQRLGLDAAVDGNTVYIADPRGDVQALQLGNGKSLWRKGLRLELSGGPGAGAGLVVVGSLNGEVVALAAANGAERWRAQVNAEVLAAPAVSNDVVVVRTVDGKLHGLSARDGSRIWTTDEQLPRLTLRGTAPPVISGDLALAGFDNGRLLAVNLATGTTAWDTAIGQSRGSSELQRMVDIDSAVAVDGDDIFVVSFQGRLVRLSRETGAIAWARELSSYRGLAIDAQAVYVSTAAGEVVRLDRARGNEQWRQKALLRRQLSAPAIYKGHLVLADLEGVVHWMKTADGSFEARSQSGARVSEPPLVAGGLLLIYNDDGDLRAFRTAG